MWYEYFVYFALYVLGFVVASFSPAPSTEGVLVATGAVSLSAFIGTLIPAFASFAKTERWQKWAIQYAIIPLFGVYTVVAWQLAGVVGLFVLACSASVHAGYWRSGIGSRAYRLEQFRSGFACQLPTTMRLIAVLNGTGKSYEADRIVQAILMGEEPKAINLVADARWPGVPGSLVNGSHRELEYFHYE